MMEISVLFHLTCQQSILKGENNYLCRHQADRREQYDHLFINNSQNTMHTQLRGRSNLRIMLLIIVNFFRTNNSLQKI